MALLATLTVAPAAALATPETTITGQPSPGAHDDTAWFSFTSDTPGATFECAVDAPTFTSCTSPYKYQGATDGSHTFRVHARVSTDVDATPAAATWSVEPLTGIGLSTQFVKRGNYIWGEGFGTGSTRQFVGNVDGNGTGDIDDDAVVFYQGDGSWYVARATDPRNGLFPPGPAWKTGFGAGSDNQFLADVNGDKNADAVTFTKSSGDWSVAPSTGTSFGTQRSWTSGLGTISENQRVADVTGDGKADAVTFDNDSGSWYVRVSNGTSFVTPAVIGQSWISGFGAGSTRRMLADVTGDGAADAVVYWANHPTYGPGTWLVAPSCYKTLSSSCSSTGSRFGTPRVWAQNLGGGDARVLMGDVGGPTAASLPSDGKADAVVYSFQPDNNIAPGGGYYVWDRLMSNGSQFTDIDGARWKIRHGSFSAVTTPLIGNMDGRLDDGAAGTNEPTEDPVVFANDEGPGLTGRWKWLPAEGHQGGTESLIKNAAGDFIGETYRPVGPGMWNSWQSPGVDEQADSALAEEGWRPTEGRYDSIDPEMADTHLKMFRDAQVDFVTTDQTNGISVGGNSVLNRSLLLCQRIGALRATDPNIPRFTTAIGDFGHANPDQVYGEAQQVYNTFVNKPTCGPVNDATGVSDGYQLLKGKPLLTLYLEHNGAGDWKKDFLDPTAPTVNGTSVAVQKEHRDWVLNTFTIRWHKGNMDPDDAFFPSDWKDYMSGIFWDGSKPSDKIMHVLPGWHAAAAIKTLPRQVSTGAEFYDVCAWQRVLSQPTRPDVVTISGFHDYHERTAVGPTSGLPADAGWKAGDYYWNQTIDYNRKRKLHQSVAAPPNTGCDHPGETGG